MGSQGWIVLGVAAAAAVFLVWRCMGKASRGACGCSGGCCGKRKA